MTLARSRAESRSKPKRRQTQGLSKEQLWPSLGLPRRALHEGARRVGIELKRFGERFYEPPKPKLKREHPILAALDRSKEVAAVVGRLRLDGNFDHETQAWGSVDGAMLSLFTRLGIERTRELGEAARQALRAAGWRILGPAPTVGHAPGRLSGVWTAVLSLAPLSPVRGRALTL